MSSVKLGSAIFLWIGGFSMVGAVDAPPTPLVGLVAYTADSAKIFLSRPAIAADATIDLQYPDAKGRPACCIRLNVDALAKPVVDDGKVSDEDKGGTMFVYQITTKDTVLANKAHLPFNGIALVHGRDSQAASVPADGLRLSMPTGVVDAQTCLSSEGMHLFARQRGKTVAHLYMGLGYEVKPTCDPKLFPVD